MTKEMLKWMADCPIAESYRIHPSLLMEIEEVGCVVVTTVAIERNPETEFLLRRPQQRTLGEKPLVVDASIREHTLQIIANGRQTPSVAIELEVPVIA